jgi:uncharacterized protein
LSPTHEQAAVCCIPNSMRFYPYYVSQMWMKTTKEDGIVAVSYGPSVLNTTVKGKKVEIVEETNYPFQENIKFTVNPEKSLKFPILFREPQWSKNTQINVSGANIERENGYIRISKYWKKGDQVEFTFSAAVIKKRFQDEVYFSRGPLVYSLGFHTEYTKTKIYPIDKFYDLNALPVTGQSLNYSIKEEPFFIFKRDRIDEMYPWKNCKIRLEGQLYNENKKIAEKVELLPYGSTLLRQTTFSDN